MPAIKLKKVTAEYLAQKEKDVKKAGENTKNEKKSLEEVADEGEKNKNEELKPFNFLDVQLLFDKRKRTVPISEQKLIEWLDDNMEKKVDVNIPLMSLYEYYTETCQLQGVNVADVPVFNKHLWEKFGKAYGFKDSSPYKGLVKERKIKKKKPRVQGETLGIKIKDIINDVITAAGNPKKGLRFNTIKMGINTKYPALRVDLYPKKLRNALERGIRFGHIELVKGVGMCGYYRLPWESTLEDDKEERKDKMKKGGTREEGKERDTTENGADTSETDDSKTEEGSIKRKLEGEEKEAVEEPPKKRQKKKKKQNKKQEVWSRGAAAKHSDPQKVDDAFPLAITYQSDPKEASGSKIKMYITKHYGECNPERLKRALESGIEKGLWEQTRGTGASGTYHLLIDTFNPSRSDTMDDRIAQAIVATHEPKQASALLIKKYISEYHPNLNTEARPYLFKHALERASNKGTISLIGPLTVELAALEHLKYPYRFTMSLRQLSGIGAGGTFLLVNHFYPSPAILAGESEDEEEFDSSDEEGERYVPRPTKRSRIISKPPRSKVDRSAPPQKKKKADKRAAKTPSKGKSQVKKAAKRENRPKSQAVIDTSEEESEEEEVYVPRPTTKRGRGESEKTTAKKATPAKAASPAKKGKFNKSKDKAADAKPGTPAKAGKRPTKLAKKRR